MVINNSFRSKEDAVMKISTTMFVTNFPDESTAKELFHACSVYGHVVDSYIPNKRAKNGKRFGFVRFINAFSEERVKEFASLANIKIALANEGFADISIQYLGEYWILVKFSSQDARQLFRDSVSVGSWFSILKEASSDFHCDKRIAWVKIEGIPFKLWTENTFKRIASR
nr:UvrD-like helicase, ATP-binding domain, P-loop containing nucleoside triphosphate hydrolase [Tanacetum cinerariifolium]